MTRSRGGRPGGRPPRAPLGARDRLRVARRRHPLQRVQAGARRDPAGARAQLVDLEDAGILERRVIDARPPGVEYRLTDGAPAPRASSARSTTAPATSAAAGADRSHDHRRPLAPGRDGLGARVDLARARPHRHCGPRRPKRSDTRPRRVGRVAGRRSANEIALRSDVIVSVCPPHAAAEVAESVSGYKGIYVDANAISPASSRAIASTIERGGGRFVDGGIVGSASAHRQARRASTCRERRPWWSPSSSAADRSTR